MRHSCLHSSTVHHSSPQFHHSCSHLQAVAKRQRCKRAMLILTCSRQIKLNILTGAATGRQHPCALGAQVRQALLRMATAAARNHCRGIGEPAGALPVVVVVTFRLHSSSMLESMHGASCSHNKHITWEATVHCSSLWQAAKAAKGKTYRRQGSMQG
jgi:hypothetical protein